MVALIWLDPGDPFPATSDALDDPPGLLAAGADLSPNTLIRAYSRGIFPWYSEGEPILWWSLSPRMVLEPQHFHLSRSLKKALRQTPFHVALDQQFDRVLERCADTPRDGQPGTWITPEMKAAYSNLHRLGYAHSVEVYLDDALVGGLYGVCLGGAFFGESMFSLCSNASKAALYSLCQKSAALGIHLIDCQMQTDHLASLGATCIERDVFEQRLARLIDESALINGPAPASWAHGQVRID